MTAVGVAWCASFLSLELGASLPVDNVCWADLALILFCGSRVGGLFAQPPFLKSKCRRPCLKDFARFYGLHTTP